MVENPAGAEAPVVRGGNVDLRSLARLPVPIRQVSDPVPNRRSFIGQKGWRCIPVQHRKNKVLNNVVRLARQRARASVRLQREQRS
jgi:hypothetical protein